MEFDMKDEVEDVRTVEEFLKDLVRPSEAEMEAKMRLSRSWARVEFAEQVQRLTDAVEAEVEERVAKLADVKDDFLAILRDQQPPVTDDHERLAELAVEFARQQYEEVRQLHLNALRKAKTYDDLVDYFDAEIE